MAISKTPKNDAGTALSQPRPQARAGLGLALVFAAASGGSIYALWPRTAEPPLTPQQARLRLDPNAATLSELMLLPGIGPAIGQHILEYRQNCTTRPALRTAEDLQAVRGIGPAAIARLRDYLQVPPQAGQGESRQ